MRCRESLWSVRIAENDKYAWYLWGEKAQFPLMLNLVVHRETTMSLTVLDTYTYIVQWIYKQHAVAQLVESLPYRLDSCGFDSRWGNCDF